MQFFLSAGGLFNCSGGSSRLTMGTDTDLSSQHQAAILRIHTTALEAARGSVYWRLFYESGSLHSLSGDFVEIVSSAASALSQARISIPSTRFSLGWSGH